MRCPKHGVVSLGPAPPHRQGLLVQRCAILPQKNEVELVGCRFNEEIRGESQGLGARRIIVYPERLESFPDLPALTLSTRRLVNQVAQFGQQREYRSEEIGRASCRERV